MPACLLKGFKGQWTQSFWIIVVCVVKVVLYVQVGYLTSFPKPRVAQKILSVINSKMALNLFAPVHVQHFCVCAEGFW